MSLNDSQRRMAQALTFPEHPVAACEEPTERLWSAAAGELSPGALSPVLEHIRGCAECAEAYQMAVRAQQTQTVATQTDLKPANSRRWVWPVAALAAAAALFAGVQFTTPDPGFRSGEEATFQLLVPNNTAIAPGSTLTWEAGEPGTRYAVMISSPDLKVVARSEGLTSARFEIDGTALADLPKGTVLKWQVIATAPDGTKQESALGNLVVDEGTATP